MAGTGKSDSEGNDMVLLKYTWNGSSFSLQWIYYYDGAVHGEDKLTGLALDQYEVPYIAGSSEGDGTGYDLAVVAINPVNGQKLWSGDGAARYNSSGSQDDFAYDFAIDKADNLIVAGRTGTSSGNQGLVAVFESTGSMKSGWPELYGDSGQDEIFYGVAADDAFNVYAAGSKTTESNGTDILVVRFSGAGSQTHATTTDGAAHLDDEARDIAVGDDAVYVVGSISTSGPTKKFAVAAYDDDDLSSSEWGGGPITTTAPARITTSRPWCMPRPTPRRTLRATRSPRVRSSAGI